MLKSIPRLLTSRYALFLIPVLLLVVAAMMVQAGSTGPSVTTDQTKYSVGETMTITGSGFVPGAAVIVSVLRPDHITDYVAPNPIVDSAGAFSAVYTPPLIPGRYKITATDGANSAITASTEADNLGYDKNGYVKGSFAPEDETGVWSSGNQGSHYTENQWTLDQYEITGITSASSVPDFDIFFNHYQSNTNAVFIDALANFRACVDCATTTYTSGPNAGMLLDGVPVPPGIDTTGWVVVPVGTVITNVNRPLNTAADGSGSTVTSGSSGYCSSNTKDALNSPSEFHCFHVNGAALAALFPAATFTSGTHTITLFYAGHLAASYVWGNGTAGIGGHEGSLGDCATPYYAKPYNSSTLTYQTSFLPLTGGCPASTGIPIYGTDAYLGWTTPFLGVGFASGSSRHWSMANQTGGSSGAIEIPIPTVAAPSNTIIIQKVTVPSTATATFNYTSPELGPFSLSNPFPASKTFTGIAPGVEYDVTEPSKPGWSLTDLSCSFTAGTDDGTGSLTKNMSTGQVGITFGATDTGVTATCTYTNTQLLPATSLSFVSQSPSGTSVEAGTSVTVTVREQNTGNVTLSSVAVTGTPCSTWSGGSTTLAPSASANFTCTFTAAAGTNSWTANGSGLDTQGNAAPSTNESQSGSFFGNSPATSLSFVSQSPSGTSVEVGTSVTITVNEQNTGNVTLTSVSVTGSPCATWSGGATTLAPSASANFTCTFTAAAGTNSWNASGHGTDPLGTVVPTGSGTPEYQAGSFFGNQPGTSLSFVSQVPSGNVEAGTSVTITVNEQNTGNTTLTSVSVTGTPCATWSGGAATLAPSASANFTCTFTAAAGTNSWNASGHGTDPLGTVVATGSGTPEYQSGSFFGNRSSTSLSFVSQIPANPIAVGTSVTITVREQNTGNNTITGVSVTGSPCATWSGGATTLAPSASANFTCTFAAALGTNSWSALGHGTDTLGVPVPATGESASGSFPGYQAAIVVNKISSNGTGTFNFSPTNFSFPGVNSLTTVAGALGTTSPSGGATTGVIPVAPGTYSVGETAPLPANFILDVSGCTLTDYLGSVSNAYGTSIANIGGVDSAWSFTVPIGGTVTCTFNNAFVPLTTRTQGFYATHTLLSDTVWNGGTLPSGPVTNPVMGTPDAYLCGMLITATPASEENMLMGGFWSNIAKVSYAKGNTGQRTDVDKARMQMLQQYLAAVLNVHLFGSSPNSYGVTLAQARIDYCTGDLDAIKADIGFLGSFNTSGDAGNYDPGMSATTQTSKDYADIDAWDNPGYPGSSDTDDPAPKLALVKVVSGGIAATTDFTLRATCTAGYCTGHAPYGGAGGMTSTTIIAGTYSLTDQNTGVNSAGYTPGTWNCGAPNGLFTLSTTTGGTATLVVAPGAVLSCTITNTHP